jgi:hypothetical protein
MPNQTVVVQKPPQVSASASIPIVKSTTNTFPKLGLAGPKGDRGDIGPEGPEYQGDDLPDFTLIFDNKLI